MVTAKGRTAAHVWYLEHQRKRQGLTDVALIALAEKRCGVAPRATIVRDVESPTAGVFWLRLKGEPEYSTYILHEPNMYRDDCEG